MPASPTASPKHGPRRPHAASAATPFYPTDIRRKAKTPARRRLRTRTSHSRMIYHAHHYLQTTKSTKGAKGEHEPRLSKGLYLAQRRRDAEFRIGFDPVFSLRLRVSARKSRVAAEGRAGFFVLFVAFVVALTALQFPSWRAEAALHLVRYFKPRRARRARRVSRPGCATHTVSL